MIPLVAIHQFTITNKRVRNHAPLSDGVYGGFADGWTAPNRKPLLRPAGAVWWKGRRPGAVARGRTLNSGL